MMEIRRSKISHLAMAILTLPFIYTIFYLFRNNQLPGNDAANYFYSAVNIYHYFQDRGVLRGLWHCYLERGWRPIFFPDLAVPFLLISKGNLFVAYWGVAILCTLASWVYVYLFFRLKLNRVSATIATSAICLLPFIQAQVVMFYAESALFPCIIGSVYHLIKSDYLRKINHSCGFVILAALAVMIRPIEAVTHLFFVFLLFFSIGLYRQIFSPKQILNVIFLALLSAFLFFAASSIPYLHSKVIPVMDDGGPLDQKMAAILHLCLIASFIGVLITGLVTLCIHFFSKKQQLIFTNPHSQNRTLLTTAFAGLFGLILIWFLPFGFETFQWIYRTSLGDVAIGTGSLSGSQFSWDVLKIYLHEEGLLAVGVMTLTMVLGMISLSSQERKSVLLSLPILYLILMMPFPFWEAFYTVQIVTRKLSIAFPALLMAMLIIGLSQGRWLRWRVSIVSLFAVIQFSLLIMLLFTKTYQNPNPIMNNSIGYFIPSPSVISPNPHDVVINFFDEQVKNNGIKAIGLEVVPGTPDARHPVEAEPINPFLLSMMLAASRSSYYSNYLYFGTYSTENIKKISRQYDAIFLSDSLNDMKIDRDKADMYKQKFITEQNPSLKTFYELMTAYSSNQLADLGWRLGPCIVINTQKHGDYKGCLLLFIKSKSTNL